MPHQRKRKVKRLTGKTDKIKIRFLHIFYPVKSVVSMFRLYS